MTQQKINAQNNYAKNIFYADYVSAFKDDLKGLTTHAYDQIYVFVEEKKYLITIIVEGEKYIVSLIEGRLIEKISDGHINMSESTYFIALCGSYKVCESSKHRALGSMAANLSYVYECDSVSGKEYHQFTHDYIIEENHTKVWLDSNTGIYFTKNI